MDLLKLNYGATFKPLHPYAAKEIDPNVPEALIDEILINAFVDSNHGHDSATCQLIIGLMIILDQTPIFLQANGKEQLQLAHIVLSSVSYVLLRKRYSLCNIYLDI